VERGTEKTDFQYDDVEPPVDRVLTMRWHDHISSAYSKAQRYHSEMWRTGDEALIAKLLAEFGDAPRGL
jgi:hypothetical protein